MVPSQPLYANTAMRKPPTRLPLPPIPVGLNQPLVIGTVPAWWVSTKTRPQIDMPTRIVYSTTAMTTWVRAVSLMPTTAIVVMTTPMAVAMATSAHLVSEALKMASTDGPSTSTPLSVPST